MDTRTRLKIAFSIERKLQKYGLKVFKLTFTLGCIPMVLLLCGVAEEKEAVVVALLDGSNEWIL